MATFIVTAWEDVESRYQVEADSAEQAEQMLEDVKSVHRGLDNGRVRQLDYVAFDVAVRRVEESSAL